MKSNSRFGGKVKSVKVKANLGSEKFIDSIPLEILLTILLNDKPISTISCSPNNLIELTVGFLINNGYVLNFSDINLIKICGYELNQIIKKTDLAVKIEVAANLQDDILEKIDNKNNKNDKNNKSNIDNIDNIDNVGNIGNKNNKTNIPNFISSACGSFDEFLIKSNLKNVNNNLKKINGNLKVKSDVILKLNHLVLEAQSQKKQIGGLHSAALFNNNGEIIYLVEDIGRHNCIDKISGYMYIKKISSDNKIIFTTGRISIDLVYKALALKVPIVVSNSSVTYSAVKLAKKANLTLIGYARGQRFNIYSYEKRISI